MPHHAAVDILTNFSRLQEIYDLRVLCWEESQNHDLVNRDLYPEGWKDALEQTSTHFIIEDKQRIVACARTTILENIRDVAHGDMFLSHGALSVAPFGYYSRMAVHPDYRGNGFTHLFDAKAMDHFKDNNIHEIVATATAPKRVTMLEPFGFRVLHTADLSSDDKHAARKRYFLLGTL